MLPSYIGTTPKYTHIYESKECVSYKEAYYLVDRFYCVVTIGYAGQSAAELVKEMKRKAFINRMLNSEDPNDVSFEAVDRIF